MGGIMTDVVVKIDLDDLASELKLSAAIDQFALSRRANEEGVFDNDEAPDIMIKTIPTGNFVQKKVIFQDRRDAEDFMYFWRRVQLVA